MVKLIKRLKSKRKKSVQSGLILILSIVLICLDLGCFAALYFQTLSDDFLQSIFLLSIVCSLTIPLCILLASQLKTYRNSEGKISNLDCNDRNDSVLDKLVLRSIAMPEK